MDTEDTKHIVISTGSWVRGMVVIVVFAMLFLIRDLVLVVLSSIVIASAIEPAAVWAKKNKIPRLPTILAIYVILGLLVAGIFYFLFLPLLGEFSAFMHSLPEYSASLASGSAWTNLSGAFSLDDILQNINSMAGSFSRGIFSSASIVFGGVVSFIIIVVLSFYLSVQENGVEKFLRTITPWKREKYVIGLWRRSQRKIGLWMQGQIILGAIIAVLVYIGLKLVGLDQALLLAVAAGLFEIIPVFGPILAAIPCILIAFSTGGTSLALITGILFTVIQQFENHLIYPLVVKKVVGVPPIVSIIALLVGAKLGGFLGILISVPVAAVLMEFLGDLEEQKIAKRDVEASI